MTHVFYILTLGLYGGATAVYLACLFRTSPLLAQWAYRLLSAGCVTHLMNLNAASRCAGVDFLNT